MKEKTKEFLKKYLIGFILGFVSVGIVAVYAETYFPSNDVTYDNTESGLSSTDVQGAIDELYGVCTKEPPAGEQIIEDAGLEKDPYECRYFFTGANPNNYITFNGEEAGWRIISVECDGTIKIIKISNIGYRAWDTSGSYGNNNWARPASLNTYLNGTYYNGLNSTAKSQIVAKNFSIGAVMRNNDLLSQVNDENSVIWTGKIALPTLSEYLRTNSNINCKTSYSYNTCKNTTWMYNNTNWWTLSPEVDSSYRIIDIWSEGLIDSSSANVTNYTVYPALYLSSEVTLTGSGTKSDPYVVS